MRLKWLLTEMDERAGDHSVTLPLLSVSITSGVQRRSGSDGTRAAGDDLSRYKVCSPGDLVINRMRAFQGALGVAPEAGLVSPDYSVLRISDSVEQRWLNYLLISTYMVSEMARLVRGIGGTESGNVRTPRLNVSDLHSIRIDLVPRAEQHAIADFLDRETARIDTLIEEQQRLIDLLRERRRAVIAQLLTPQPDWLRARIKHVGSTNLGKMLDAGRTARPDDRHRPYVRAADVLADGTVNLANLNQMPFSDTEMAQFDLRAHDILLIEGGATVGRPGFLFNDASGIAFQKTVNRLRVGSSMCARFCYWVMLRLYESNYYTNHYGAVSFVHLTGEKLREIELSFPPLVEQRRIASALDQQTSRIDALIAESEHFIELARERRSALITAAVTGQIDVREAS